MNVAEVVARLQKDGNVRRAWTTEHRDPRPLGPARLGGMRLPDGSALPQDLVTWLAYDASWFGLVDGTRSGEEPRLAVTPLREILVRWASASGQGDDEAPPRSGPERWSADDMVKAWIDLLPDNDLVDALAIELPPSGSQEHLLVLRAGRAPAVLGCHKRYEFWWKYHSFACYLAHYFGYEDPE